MGIQTDIDKEIKKSAKIFLYSLTYDELIRRWKNSSSGSGVRKQLELRMDELNKTQLPKITDYDELIRRWENSSFGSDVEKQLELRMDELNKTCADYDELIRRWENSNPASGVRKQLELRIKVLIDKDKFSLNKAFQKGINTPFLKEKLTSMAKNIV